ncbi:MAG: hypothetical protein U1F41_12995 [Burkholderiales bacterium]
MFDLPLDKATVRRVGGHQYYIFPKPATHTNATNRPPTYANPALLTRYNGAGSNGQALLLPGEVQSAANAMMSTLRRYGDRIDDWSMKSAVIQNGYRPDNASQGANYLRIIKQTIREKPDVFGSVTFPANLETEAQSVLGRPGDARRNAFHQHLASAPGWSAQLASRLFDIVDRVYAPRGSNPHATGLVFDLDFTILVGNNERNLGANAALNDAALRSAAGRWLNQYSMMFGFDSYDTNREIWHQEFRSPREGAGSPQAIELLNSCGPALEAADDLRKYGEAAIREALKRIP